MCIRDRYTTWTEIWKVAVNETKSSAVLFSKRRKEPVSYTHLDVYKRQGPTCRIQYHNTDDNYYCMYIKVYDHKSVTCDL